jgi:signal transduction histidine kinase
MLPLSAGEDPPLGVLTFADLECERTWDADTLRRLRLVGTIFAGAISRQRSYLALAADASERKMAEEALRDLSQRLLRAHEEERALLARELHDDLSQRLAVLAIDVGVAELETHEAEQASRMRAVRESLVSLSEDVHSLSYQLHPSILDELGLPEALEAEAAQFRRRSTAAVTTRFAPMTRSLGRDEALCLFRVAQEALHNTARHAGASAVSLDLCQDDGGWLLTIADDGIGFDQAAARRRRNLGLESMGERVRLVRGRLAVDSGAGRGTMIGVWVPALETTA